MNSSASERARKAAERVEPGLSQGLSNLGAALGDPVFMRVFKETSELEVWVRPGAEKKFKRFRTYRIAKFSGTLGPKKKEGDRQAVEGFYWVNRKAMNPHSKFHLSFNLGYPNAYDRAWGRTGNYLMVHGSDVSVGCFAMTDDKIEEIYTLADRALKNGQRYFRVHCFPFRMTAERLNQVSEKHPWRSFWKNLAEGYEYFETHGIPPNTTVQKKQYLFR